jgi:hypothetical protein
MVNVAVSFSLLLLLLLLKRRGLARRISKELQTEKGFGQRGFPTEATWSLSRIRTTQRSIAGYVPPVLYSTWTNDAQQE